MARIEGIDAIAGMPALGIGLPLAEIYDGIELPVEAPIRQL